MSHMNNNSKHDTKALSQAIHKPIIDWSDQLACGLDDVDAQHHKLIDLVNKLGNMQACNTAMDELIDVYDELKNYTLYHFKHEEDLMNSCSVDEANKKAHFNAHQGFIERITKIDQLIVSHPAYVVDHLLAFLVKWLIHHISVVDKRMAGEVIALRTGQPLLVDAPEGDPLSDTISELYDGIGLRSLEMIDLNIQLQSEMEHRRQAEDDAQLAVLVFDNSSDAMTVSDAKNNIIAVNPAFTRLSGYKAEEIIGKNPNILSSGRHDPSFYQVMWESLVATGHWDGELWNRHKNGNVYAESLAINTIYNDDGSVDRRVAVFSDITEKKLTQEKLARQAIELRKLVESEAQLNARLSQEIAVKNRLFSIVSHDLRSPFTLLTGMTQTMLQKADIYSKEELIEKIRTVNRVSKGVYNAVENLLEWSRAQLEGGQSNIQQIVLKDIFAESLEILDPVAMEKEVDVINVVGDQEVCADHHVVLTIVRNLISNAIKFSHNGGTVEVSARNRGDKVEIAVSDNGVGIPAAKIDKLFAMDQKTTTLGTEGEKGTGLGLPLCADLVNKLGGTMRIQSIEGKGSRFVVTLPASCSNKP